ncbi:MAG: InlB B-repeat-containing protein, partial [Bacteroidaceae bacterium]|nr:InlB B-repeat-containing protein [Bacteroidaceae bacterium]
AFHACDALASVNIEASTEPLEFVTGYYRSFGDAAKEVFVGRNINRTGDYTNERVFNNMTKLTIGDMVTEIGSNMFNGNNELKAVYVSWTQPITINTNVFNNATYQTATLYVPGGTKAKYAAATGWKNFYNVQAWSVIVKLTASAHGTIKTKYGTASNGSTIQFNQPKDEPLVYTITADNGYKLSALTDNGTAVSPLPQLGTAQTRAIADGEETIILAATFAPVSYTITYDLAGGAMPSGKTNPTSYNIETATFTLNNPTRDYYDFAGWTGTGLTAPTKTVTIAKGSTGNRSYTATWTPKTYTVTITGAGVTASNYSPKYGESVVITIEEDPDRTLTSLTVNGTDVTSQVRNNKYTITNVSSNIEVVATFKSTKEFITLTDQYAMFSCPQDLDFTGTSLRAYIASGFNKATSQVLLTPVTDVPAGTGIFLIGTPGQTYKIPYSETTSYYVNLFQANLTKKTVSATTGSYSNYTFGVQGGDPGFYPINGSTTLQAQTAYLQLPTSFVTAGVKVSVVFEDDIIDGIDTIDNGQWTIDNEVYNLAGQRLGKMQKGINIVNGKKVLVK